MHILVVEDERALSDVLVKLLRQNRYAVTAVYDGLRGEENIESGLFDAVILDIMLPGKNGLDVLRSVRGEGIQTPILLLTAKSEVQDKITGLDLGADDYLSKPFATGELLARLRAITRRKGEITGDEVEMGGTALSRHTHEISHAGSSIKLGLKEYQIMEMLMENKKQIIPKERFVEKIWGPESEAEYNAIEVYISFLRKKLAFIGTKLEIRAVRGIGYILEENP